MRCFLASSSSISRLACSCSAMYSSTVFSLGGGGGGGGGGFAGDRVPKKLEVVAFMEAAAAETDAPADVRDEGDSGDAAGLSSSS